MLLKHFFVEKISHSSYFLAGNDSCAVIDPRRDVDIYIEEARARKLKITHILETHLHADFISGHMDLAARTGAKIYAPKSARCDFDHEPLSEGDVVDIEDMSLKVLETPGHTPEHISYVITDTSRGEEPIGVFTGDTMFVGDVGRPDLFPDMAEELGGKLFHSLHDKLMKLPDFCEVYPAHAAGSLCGRAMAAKWRTTIGYERKYNSALQIKDKDEFVKHLTTGMPPAPDHFSRCSDINRKGPARMDEFPPLLELDPAAFRKEMEKKGTQVLDARAYYAFGGQHVPGSWNIAHDGNFPTFAGWVMPPSDSILLVTESHGAALEAAVWLRRIGLDNVTGYLRGGVFEWAVSGFDLETVKQISTETLHHMTGGASDFVLLDVRAPMEYEDNHIKGAVNISAPDLRERHGELNPEKLTVVMCSTGHRSSLAVSILKRHGFDRLYNVAGGITGYSKAGYARRCSVCVNPHGSRFFNKEYHQSE